MPESVRELIVFPTELALRRYQQDQALAHGWVDTSRHTTFSRLRRDCLSYAKIKGRQMDAACQLLVRRQVVEVASGHFHGLGALGEVSPNALGGILDQLITELASLPGETGRIIEWLLDHHRTHKLYQLGTLVSVWRANCTQEGWADAIDVNGAILRLLAGNRAAWPPLLRNCRSIVFKSVRWFNPFEESCVSALDKKLKVRVESALPPAHAEVAADRLGQQVRSEIMGAHWAVWTEDLGDALAVDSADVLQLEDTDRISFSRSAGAYGEIEDLARRICWNLLEQKVLPSRIALVVPNIGSVQDIVPHVFKRFQIPYYFRRGRPVLSSAVVKAFCAWLAFPIRPVRDVLIDLVRNPAINVENRDVVEVDLMKHPPLVDPMRFSFFADVKCCSGLKALELLEEWVIEPEDHFNGEALKAVVSALEKLGDQSLPLAELVDLLEELLQDATVRPLDSHEQGVWIINPHDAVGIEFDLVFFAGLNEGDFPGIPPQDALLSDTERHFLREYLEEQGTQLPKMALPKVDVLLEQQSVLFLTALGMAREQLIFSFQSVDQEGNEKGAGEYYRKLWSLSGWPAKDEVGLSPYDQWRIFRLPEGSIFSNHWSAQVKTAPEDRIPMPSESFLPIVPLPLCRATDEALQSAVYCNQKDIDEVVNDGAPNSLVHLVDMLGIETERQVYLETDIDEREPSVFCGHVSAVKGRISEWFDQKAELSPTALETLAENRYVFLIERIFGAFDPRCPDDTPDPMDRGGLIHRILQEIYTAIATGSAGIETPRYWAVKGDKGWKKRTEEGLNAVPLAVFVPEFRADYEAFARKIAEKRMREKSLGHPGVWAAEREKILEIVLNFVRYDADTCCVENRFPALFEQKFANESSVDLGEVRLHGIIDRVDLLFAETGELKTVRVLDYKGTSRARSKSEEYIAEIVRNLDCQLPVYAFAAQQYFFGSLNTDELNAKTETGYLVYQRTLKDIGSSLKKSIISMDEPGLVDGFLATLESNIRKLKQGDFSVDPLIKTYADYMSICRTIALERGELEQS